MSTHTGMDTDSAATGRTEDSSGGGGGDSGRGSRTGRSGGRLNGGGTTSSGRLRALARAELTLLIRTKSVIVTAVLVPLALPFSIRPALDEVDRRLRA
jgi:ABC-2 type transport system permease protein